MKVVQEAISYFEEMIESDQSSPSEEYVKGIEFAVRLLEAKQSGFFSQDEFDEYLLAMEKIESPGSMYFWLWQHSVHLAYDKGLKLPKHHIWGDNNKGKIKCIDPDSFSSSLVMGNWYKILDEVSKPGFVRIIAEKNKYSWFPLKCFAVKQEETREYMQKL